MKNIIITGSTGMVGKGVLLECLDHHQVAKILLINRNPIGINHPKITEIIHDDFLNFEDIKDSFSGYDACFHCMGVSSLGMDETTYVKLTYLVTEALATALYDINANMTVTYVSGDGTNSSESGSIMWARIKGKTENMLFNKGFNDVYAFRAGAILPEKGVKSKVLWINLLYLVLKPMFPLLKRLSFITTSSRVGKAMILLIYQPCKQKILSNTQINQLTS
tara:strand:+ start:380 stop:1042 length:663 start_codon:yes stop_codon:yes gene_type:complete